MQSLPGPDPIDNVRSRLLDNCHLFDDPASYRAGVDDAAEAFGRLLSDPNATRLRSVNPLHPAGSARTDHGSVS
jgi:hypothetical protein